MFYDNMQKAGGSSVTVFNAELNVTRIESFVSLASANLGVVLEQNGF